MSDIKRAQEAFRLYRENADTDYASILDLVTQGVDVQATDDNKQILLHRATYNGNRDVCELLIQQGADVHAKDKWGQTPLLLAAGGGHTEMIKLLLDQGANIWAEKHRDLTRILIPHRDNWLPKLEKVKQGKLDDILNPQDLYHLASVMKPENPQNAPHPKEFIRILFQQYLPHEPKFNAMYEEIFSQQRPAQYNLQSARKSAQGRGVVL